MAQKQTTFEIRGAGVLLYNNERTSNALDPFSQELERLKKEKKAKGADKLAVMAQYSDVEWESSLYHDPKIGPYIPTTWLTACIRAGARITRGGKSVERGIIFSTDKFPLQYEGPRGLEELRKEAEFIDQRMVRVGRDKVLRSRGRFHGWSVKFDVGHNDLVISEEDLITYVRYAGLFEGIGDGRTIGFGRFSIYKIDGKKLSAEAAAA